MTIAVANALDNILKLERIEDALLIPLELAHCKAKMVAKMGQSTSNRTTFAQQPTMLRCIEDIQSFSSGGQVTIPIVAAIKRVEEVHYGKIISSIASKSAGPGAHANIDEFTETK